MNKKILTSCSFCGVDVERSKKTAVVKCFVCKTKHQDAYEANRRLTKRLQKQQGVIIPLLPARVANLCYFDSEGLLRLTSRGKELYEKGKLAGGSPEKAPS